jgi:NADH-quinone oxidoreductase subunit J
VAETVLFYIFALGVVLAGSQVVFRRNPIHAALSLVACFFFLAGIYVLLAAHLIAILQIMVYAGAVMVLFVFVIMLLNLKDEELGAQRITVWKALGLASVLAAVGAVVARAFAHVYGQKVTDLAMATVEGGQFGSLKAVARAIYLNSVLPFELTSLLLLVAVVGAVVVAKGRI